MKTLVKLTAAACCLAAVPLPAQGDPHAAWKQAQKVELKTTHPVVLGLSHRIVGASQPGLEDLRLVNPQGVETPYAIEWPRDAAPSEQPAASFHVRQEANRTVLEIDPAQDRPLLSVTLVTSTPVFVKSATVQGSNDGAQWQPLAVDELLFRQADGSSRLRLPLPVGEWKHLRVLIDDSRTPPVVFTQALVEARRSIAPLESLDLDLQKREELPGHTRLTMSLPAANLWVRSLELHISTPVFHRQVQVLVDKEVIASATLFHLSVEGRETSALELAVNKQVQASALVIDIDNGDSPPLAVESAKAVQQPLNIAFYVDVPGIWTLYTGNPAAHAPRYDVAALAENLRLGAVVTPPPSSLAANPAFDAAAALPETGSAGAVIDLNGWAARKPVTAASPGVWRVELDAETLAHASSGFADLRVVQGGRQLPYLLQKTARTRELPLNFKPAPDPKQPALGRWELKLPLAGLPVKQLVVTSGTPLFSRSFTLSQPMRDLDGRTFSSQLASGSWDQKPGDARPLKMDFYVRPQADTLLLETNNGDNAPVQVDTITAQIPVVELLFKTTSPAPVHLCYSNPQAATPRYDLSLVENDLRAASSVPATLGAEEKLKPGPAAIASNESAATPWWLWAVLGLVVVSLLGFVAKLLPKTEA